MIKFLDVGLQMTRMTLISEKIKIKSKRHCLTRIKILYHDDIFEFIECYYLNIDIGQDIRREIRHKDLSNKN